MRNKLLSIISFIRLLSIQNIRMPTKYKIIGYVEGLPVELISIEQNYQSRATKNILITGGVHGNERSGPYAAQRIASYFNNSVYSKYSYVNIYIIPKVNPIGWINDKRRNGQNIDINRDMKEFKTKESKLIKKVMDDRRYDLFLDCHSYKGAKSFFVLSANDKSDIFGKEIMDKFKLMFHAKKVPFKNKRYRLVSPGVFRSINKNTLKSYMCHKGTEYSFTIEAPRNAGLIKQIEGTYRLLHLFIENLR